MEVDNNIYACPICYQCQTRQVVPDVGLYLCHNCFRLFYLVTNLLGELTFLKASVRRKVGRVGYPAVVSPDEIPF